MDTRARPSTKGKGEEEGQNQQCIRRASLRVAIAWPACLPLLFLVPLPSGCCVRLASEGVDGCMEEGGRRTGNIIWRDERRGQRARRHSRASKGQGEREEKGIGLCCAGWLGWLKDRG